MGQVLTQHSDPGKHNPGHHEECCSSLPPCTPPPTVQGPLRPQSRHMAPPPPEQRHPLRGPSLATQALPKGPQHRDPHLTQEGKGRRGGRIPQEVTFKSVSCHPVGSDSLQPAHQASLSFTNYQSSLKLKSITSVMPSNHLILCRFLLLPPILPSIRVFSNESDLHMRWPTYWSFSISPSNEYSGLISFRIDWFGSPCSPRDS